MENIFRYYAAKESLYTATVTPVCEKHGLTYMEFTVLMFLANNPQFDTAADVVKYRHLTKSHVSMSVRSLEAKGLLKRAYHPTNKRSIHLTVRPTAAHIVADGRAAQKAFGEILFADFTEAEHQLMLSFMHRIDQNIEKHTKASRSERNGKQ